MKDYKTIKHEGIDEFIEKKSRFIGYSKPVTTAKEAIEFINQKKQEHYDATHNVYAYVLRENNIERYSDDGEPAGTAGVPVLEVIKKEGLTDVVVVATRYFGGTMLGAGGLIRAYTQSAKIGLVAGEIVSKIYSIVFTIGMEYSLLGKVQYEVNNLGHQIMDVSYSNLVTMTVCVPFPEADRFEKKIIDCTNALVTVSRSEKPLFVEVSG